MDGQAYSADQIKLTDCSALSQQRRRGVVTNFYAMVYQVAQSVDEVGQMVSFKGAQFPRDDIGALQRAARWLARWTR